jgi:hypothetical protein
MLPSVIGGPAGAWGSSVAWFQEDQGASSALFSYHRLVPVSALVLVILNLPAAIAVRAVLTIIYPATAVTMWTNLHCQHLLFQSSITEA